MYYNNVLIIGVYMRLIYIVYTVCMCVKCTWKISGRARIAACELCEISLWGRGLSSIIHLSGLHLSVWVEHIGLIIIVVVVIVVFVVFAVFYGLSVCVCVCLLGFSYKSMSVCVSRCA